MDTLLDPQESIALTKWHIQEKQLDKALIQIKPVIQGEAAEPEALLIAARLYAQLQLFSHAQNLFSQYLEKNGDDSAAKFQLGMSYFDNGDNDKASETWSDILKTEKNHPPALFYSAIVLLQKQDSKSALVHLKNIIASTSSDNLYYNKAKELIIEVEKNSSNVTNINSKEIYKTEH